MRDAVNIEDLARLAQRHLPKVIWDYLDGGSDDEVTLKLNRTAFGRYQFRPRMVTGNATRDMSVELFGERFATPFLIGPTGLAGIFTPDGDLKLSRAAATFNTGFCLSTASNNSLEQVAKHSQGPRFFQLYPWGGRDLTLRLLERAKNSGYAALMVTVDMITAGNRERDVRNKFANAIHLSPRMLWDAATHPRWVLNTWVARGMPRLENLAEFLPAGSNAYDLVAFTKTQRNPSYSWSDLEWIRGIWKGPLIIKGILTAEDTTIAARLGADAVVVSNHGGRSLDGAVASLDALPEVVASAGSMKVLVDGGFRRGTDIVKAMALGAHAVLLGRSALYGLAAGGEQGVLRALEMLRDETDRTMSMLGCQSISEVTANHISHAIDHSSS